MKFALVNSPWSFEGSIYFGCREPHLPLEYGYARQLLQSSGHEAVIIDGHMENLDDDVIARRIGEFDPDIIVIATAPSYLFWRCAQPELRVPLKTLQAIRHEYATGSEKKLRRRAIVAVGPHGSTTPEAVLLKLGVDAVLLGECEEILPLFRSPDPAAWKDIQSICYRVGEDIRIQGRPHISDLASLPAIRWPDETIRNHRHHHHRFDNAMEGMGAEVEASRGCPYHCSFCAKETFRGPYRRRPPSVLLEEMRGLIAQGVKYFYFIDEIFFPDEKLLRAISEPGIKFGIQTRIELWEEPLLELLGKAGCVSIEAGIESITEEGRRQLNKNSSLSLAEIAERLIHAKKNIHFVQSTLLENKSDTRAEIEAWRKYLLNHGVWANKPVPLFPYPGSREYSRRWGQPDNLAWERAHAVYLADYAELSDIQEKNPLSLETLEMVMLNGT
jgi:anaerobic magnesium-protoporphyrin IX monomethyl ester cyclase